MRKEINKIKRDSFNSHELLLDDLFFRVISRYPPDDLKKYLKLYLPSLCAPLTKSGWTIYPEGSFPETYKAKFVYEFRIHPYFTGNYSGGELIFYVELLDGKVEAYSIRHFDLYLNYQNIEGANLDYDNLRNMLSAFYYEEREENLNEQKYILLSPRAKHGMDMELSLSIKDYYAHSYKIEFKHLLI
jgi:hypothetical protein